MSAVMSDRLPRPRVSVEEYYRMAEVGLLAPDARTELIEGEVIEMPPVGSSHSGVVSQLQSVLSVAVGHLAQVRVQQPIRLDNYSEPQPDLTIVLPRKDFYRARLPDSADALLIIEVSQSSLRLDRDVKVPLYSRHHVPEVWLLDLPHDRIHFFRAPRDGTYTDVSFMDDPKVVALSALPEITVDLSGLFAL
jgi:Uma2 family endonuclease